MKHLSLESLSEYLDGCQVPGAEEHLVGCARCREELESMRELRDRLRSLPQLEAPPELWAAIRARLATSGASGARARAARIWSRGRIGSRGWVRQAVGMAAVFLLGLGLGRAFWPDSAQRGVESPVAGTEPATGSRLVGVDDPATSLAEVMAEVRREGSEYEAALRRLEEIARQAGTPVPNVAEQRLAALDALVEASRTALSAEPTDPVLNAYLFAALEQRADVVRQAADRPEGNRTTVWR